MQDGRFVFQPDPPTPFEVLVIDSAGTYSRPILIEALDPAAELVVTIAPILNESVTVSGSAPSIESTPGAGTTSLSAARRRHSSADQPHAGHRERGRRQPGL